MSKFTYSLSANGKLLARDLHVDFSDIFDPSVDPAQLPADGDCVAAAQILTSSYEHGFLRLPVVLNGKVTHPHTEEPVIHDVKPA